MSKYRQETVETYNRSALQLAEYFRGIGARTDDIKRAFALAGNPKSPKVVEVGCGDGRDAKVIVTLSGSYTGFDISEELIKLARQQVPGADFQVADAIDFDYPSDVDVVFAFASLLHLDKNEVAVVLQKVADSLRPGGIFYISLKHADSYQELLKEDQFGTRMFYLYSEQDIRSMSEKRYETVMSRVETKGHTPWLEIALQTKR